VANATVYGRTTTGEYVPLQVDANGVVATGAGASSTAGTVAISGTVSTLERSGTVTAVISGTVSTLEKSGTITAIDSLGGTVETKPYTTVLSGELAVGTAAGGTAAATAACKLVRFKARTNNAGTVYMGGGTTVTAADGTTDTTTGYPMIASDDTGWMPASNVSNFFFISNGAGNAVIYLALT